ncbi:hypothetical protein GW17_00003881 [Ensete ventricosum]|nr:hypothetical protein GW17_00003881 [Ensete ventricosum]
MTTLEDGEKKKKKKKKKNATTYLRFELGDSQAKAREKLSVVYPSILLLCRLDLFSFEYASSLTSVVIGTFDAGCSLLGDLRFGRWSVRPSGHLGADDPAHRPLRGWEG